MPIAPEQLLGCWALGMGTTLYDYDYESFMSLWDTRENENRVMRTLLA